MYLPMPDFMASVGTGWEGGQFVLSLFFHARSRFVVFYLVRIHLLRTGLGRGPRGACNVPSMCGQRTGNMLTHVLGVAYVASAPLVFRSRGLDSVALGFVEMF